MEKSIETKDREILDIIKTKEDIINEQKNKINDYEKDKANSINKLRQELEILKKGNNEKEQQILLLNNNMDNIKEENNKISKEKEIQISNLEEKIKLLIENDEKNKNMLKEKDNKISLLEQSQNTELDDINKKYNEIIFKLQKETKEKEKIISEKKELELNNSKLETNNNNLVNIDNNSFHQNNSNIINIQNNEVEQLSYISNQNNNNIINNNNINNNIINVSNVINVDNQNNEHPKNDEKLFTNTGTEIKGNNEQSAINTHIIINNFYNNNNNNVNESQNSKEEGYSFDCSNSMYLSVYISLGSDEAKFEIYLKNNGTKTWAPDSKLKIDKTSDCTVDEVILAPQKPNEERSYSITVKDLHNYPAGDYNVIFLFWSNGNYHGEKIQAVIRIKEKENIESEIAEYIDKIKEFRDYYSLSEEDYPNDKILEALKENDFNYENAFSSIFN